MTDQYNRTIDYLRVSVTDRCNLRCVYCMPEEGVQPVGHGEMLTYEEILRVCRCAARVGISKIKLTGGEPLARRGVAGLVARLREIDGISEVTMTSNGVLLYDELPRLAQAGLDAVNISLDTLDPARFEKITRRAGLETVLASIDRALSLGVRVKVNCLPVRELNGGGLAEMAGLAQDRPIDVRFIELMPIGCGKGFTAVPSGEVRGMIAGRYGPLSRCDEKRGNGPAQYYEIDGFLGKLGFISAVSTGFCGECNRVRLTSTGFLKLCLHYNKGIELRGLLRGGISDSALTALLHEEILHKPARHHFGADGPDEETRGMAQIGG